ncbi:MAG: mono/diheme cytochrome c family protein [Paracoccaceae bacterium]|jgi:mono/diheme cytochrome c family protein
MLKLIALFSVAAVTAACVHIITPTARAPLTLSQGWDAKTRELFAHTPQGSRMMPNAWFRALERSDGAGLFSDPGNLTQYGLIPGQGASPLNPDGYPVGFALDPGAEATRQVGLTCAACHTAIVTVEGREIRIDGAPAHLDFDSFYADLNHAVGATAFDQARFMRFAARVLEAPGAAEIGALQQQFASFQLRLSTDATLRRPTVASGFGRVDALTQIINSLAARDQHEVANIAPVGAPTSYPPLWLTPKLEYVQWNPIAANPIGRNGGEALGVFGVANLNAAAGAPFASSILLKELHTLEAWVADLSPPPWDEKIMGPIDVARAAEGGAIFADKCAACHTNAPYRMTDKAKNFFGKDFIAIGRVDFREVGTDPAYMQAMLLRNVKTNAVTAPLFEGREEVPAAEFFLRTVGTLVAAAMQKAGLSPEEQADYSGYRATKGPDGKPVAYEASRYTDLKASPLAGVWATGPYLHNGSVATVYELLSPEAQRRQTFWTGGRELDRAQLGFVSDEAPGLFRFDTTVPGNGAMGHNYPEGGLNHGQRMAVIEYLKTQ